MDSVEPPSRRADRKERARIIRQCLTDTIEYINARAGKSVSADLGRSEVLTVNSYFLLSDAYKRRRGMKDSRTHLYKVATFVVAAIMAVRPIRVLDPAKVVSTRVAFANQQCAMRAAQALLGLDLERLDEDYIRRMYWSAFDLVQLPCLSNYIGDFERLILSGPYETFDQIEDAMDYNRYNAIEISDPELKILETLINLFQSLEKNIGHPFSRVLLGWSWRWN